MANKIVYEHYFNKTFDLFWVIQYILNIDNVDSFCECFVGDLSGLAGFHNMVGLGHGALLLPPVQASALGMPLLQGPDGAINLLNNIQVETHEMSHN